MRWSLMAGMAFRSPFVSPSTWADIAQRRNRPKPPATDTMISRAPVSGSRRRFAAPGMNGRVAMVLSYPDYRAASSPPTAVAGVGAGGDGAGAWRAAIALVADSVSSGIGMLRVQPFDVSSRPPTSLG